MCSRCHHLYDHETHKANADPKFNPLREEADKLKEEYMNVEGKILKEIKGKSLLEIHLERLKKCKNVSEIIVATTTNIEDELIYNKSIELGVSSYRGSEFDVLDRFYKSIENKPCSDR